MVVGCMFDYDKPMHAHMSYVVAVLRNMWYCMLLQCCYMLCRQVVVLYGIVIVCDVVMYDDVGGVCLVGMALYCM